MTRTALVVGAAGGVGLEVVKALIGAGYRVLGSVLNEQEAVQVKASSPSVERLLTLDLGNADSVLAELRGQSFASLDAVVICAAIAPFGPVENAALDVLRRTLEINTVATAAIYQATMPALRAAKGRLVLISSFSGKIGLPFIGYYTASKHALEGLGDVMRREAKDSGVKVVVIEPGGIDTPMVANQVRDVTREREQLSPAASAQYRGLYDGFLRLVEKSRGSMLAPAQVASVVVEAVTTTSPQARYQVGEDSKFLCDIARRSDVEIDAVVQGFWSNP